MANNQKFTLTFDAQLNINQMKGALSQIQSTLNGLHLPQNIARGLQGTFDKLSNEIQNFEVAIGKDITSKADFKKIENQADKIGEAFRRLKIQVGSLTGLSGKELEKLFPISVTQNIKKASSAIEQYSKKVTDATKAVDGQRASIEKTKKDIQIIQNKPLWTDQDQKQLRETGKEITNLQDRAAELKENLKNLTNKKTGQPILEENWKKSPAGREYLKELEEINKKTEELLEKQKQLEQTKGVSIRAGTQARELEQLNRDLEEAQQKLVNFENAKKQIESFGEGGDLKNLLDEIGKLTGLDMSKFTADIDGAGEAIKIYLDQETQKASENVDKLTASIKNAEQPIRDTGEAVREYGERVDYADQKTREVDALKQRITYFFGLNNTIQLVKRTMKSAISTIKELDEAMTATAVVTDFTVADMWEQLPEYTKRANELGVSTKAAYEAATLYYQQGLKTNEVMAISNETLKMARIAGLDAATATDRVTNAIRGFNMAINEVNAQRINDVYSRLAAISASNVDEISTAMTKVASLANSANMKFETTAAFLAQIVETTRESAETAGTALKTVIARFSEVKKLYSENELRGTDEEGLEIDVNKISTALRTAGIDLNKYFLGEVGLDDIFMELASKWDKLTSVQQRYIATQAA